MKHPLLTTIAAVLLVGCGESQQSTPSPETKPDEPVAKASKPEPPTAKAPDISIHVAANDGHIEGVKQHLAAGTDVNAADENGWTALHQAAFKGRKEIAELLIAKGADVNAKDSTDGGTPLDMAEASWSPNGNEIADLLRKHGGKSGF
ncbi:ankyrin repeat domain-containing protein [bacterium]|nr:ankyrin repeat domain-containing protein [bacterium]